MNSASNANKTNVASNGNRNSNSTQNRGTRRTASSRSTMPRNPGSRSRPPRSSTPRGGNYLALTRDQFTATSPLNLFQIGGGSTPGGTRIHGRELVGSCTTSGILAGAFAQLLVGGTTPFTVTPASFPRLSAYVPLYEYYKFHRLAVLFQANQPTTATGEVLLAVDYDVKDSPPTTSVGMMRNISSTMANLYSDASLEVLGSLSRLPKFECAANFSPDNNQLLQAALFVAVEGVTAVSGQSLGYVVCQYDIEFFTPA